MCGVYLGLTVGSSEEIKGIKAVVFGGNVEEHILEVEQHRSWVFGEFDGGHGVDDFITEGSKKEKTSLL
ncbi:hypothetical protein SARC_13116, partial [Sphaeroforma arctica JP610]